MDYASYPQHTYKEFRIGQLPYGDIPRFAERLDYWLQMGLIESRPWEAAGDRNLHRGDMYLEGSKRIYRTVVNDGHGQDRMPHLLYEIKSDGANSEDQILRIHHAFGDIRSIDKDVIRTLLTL
jgi:hypothetical protein